MNRKNNVVSFSWRTSQVSSKDSSGRLSLMQTTTSSLRPPYGPLTLTMVRERPILVNMRINTES